MTVIYSPIGQLANSRPSQFPLGIKEDGHEALWKPEQNPVLTVHGGTGSGKSVLMREITLHALGHPTIDIVIIDPRHLEGRSYIDVPGVLAVAQTEEEISAALKYAQRRLLIVADSPRRLLVIVHDACDILGDTRWGSPTAQSNARVFAEFLQQCAERGRARGVSAVIGGHRLRPFEHRTQHVLMGRIPRAEREAIFGPSSEFLDPSEFTHPSGGVILGRGFMDGTFFQGYFTDLRSLPVAISLSVAKRESLAREATSR